MPAGGTGGHPAVWSAYSLRKQWNQVKEQATRVTDPETGEITGPWWADNSKECYATGIADAVTALTNWHGSKRGKRPGPGVRFPKCVDVGIGHDLLIVMRPDGTVAEKVPNPRALRASLAELRRANRALARKTEGSPRWRTAKRRLARAQGRAANIRRDVIHKATTRLAHTHGTVVIEDLQVRQLARGLRSRSKSWIDASAGELRRQLEYKTGWYGSGLWIADRWYPSSKTCSTCGQVNAALTMSDRTWACGGCGTTHDRDQNAGTNLARLPASWAEAQSSEGMTGLARHAAVKRVNRLRKAA